MFIMQQINLFLKSLTVRKHPPSTLYVNKLSFNTMRKDSFAEISVGQYYKIAVYAWAQNFAELTEPLI